MRTLLVTPDRRTPAAERLESLLRVRCDPHLAVAALDDAEGRCRAAGHVLVVVLLDPGRPAQALAAVRGLRTAGAERQLIVGPASDPKFILAAMQAGGDYFLDQEELEAGLDAAFARFCLGPGHRAGELLAVLSAAGGCGASTLAVNLAVVLARSHGRCNLLDLSTNKADLAALLDLKPQYTLTDLCRREERLDRTLYGQLLTAHESGVSLLAGPRGYDEARAFTTGGVEQAVDLARSSFSHVVADLEDCFHAEQLAVLAQATRVLVVCRLDFLAVRNARRILEHLRARGVAPGRVEFVVNQAGRSGEVALADAEEAIGERLRHLLPDAPETVCRAANSGVPAAVAEPDSPFAQGVARLVGLAAPAPQKRDLPARARAWVADRLRSWSRALRARLNPSPVHNPGPPEVPPHDLEPAANAAPVLRAYPG